MCWYTDMCHRFEVHFHHFRYTERVTQTNAPKLEKMLKMLLCVFAENGIVNGRKNQCSMSVSVGLLFSYVMLQL